MKEELKQSIIKSIADARGDYRIRITDHVCALQFKAYAKSEKWNGNEFNISFEDANGVAVSLADFIEYQLYYSDAAIDLETKFSDNIDDLRDMQNDIKDELLLELEAE